jgi:hypothetical protein
MLRDVLSLKGMGQKFEHDLDARIAVDVGGACMNSGTALVRSGGSFKTGCVRGEARRLTVFRGPNKLTRISVNCGR